MTGDAGRGAGLVPGRDGGRIYLFAYLLLSVLLVWQIVASAMASGLETRAPEQARRWRAGQPEALLSLAQDALNDQDLRRANRYAVKALTISPSLGVAYRILGQAAERSGDHEGADRLYAQAYSLTHRDAALASILFEKAAAAGRYDEALQQAEVIIRRAPPQTGVVIAKLAGLASNPRSGPAMGRRLAENPHWRPAFFRELGRRGDYATALTLYEALQPTRSPATDEELSPILNRMVWSGQADAARAAWIKTLPARRRPGASEIYNPNFQAPAGRQMFDWRLPDDRGGLARLPAAGEKPGLHVQVEGLGEAHLAHQLLVLAPGRYVLTSRARLVDGAGVDLQWRLGCGAILGEPLTLSLSSPGAVEGRIELDLPRPCNADLNLHALERDRGDPVLAVVETVRLQRPGSAP